MKTVTTIDIIWEDGDKELIFSKLPKNPCESCFIENCFCCSKGKNYNEIIENLKERGIFELTVKANEYYRLEQEIKRLNEKKKEIRAEFSKLGLDIA